MSDKPVYQGSRNPSLSWKEITQEEFNQVSESISKGCTGLFVQVLYPASAYEAQRNEVEKLKAENEALRFKALAAIGPRVKQSYEREIKGLEDQIEAQAKRIAELEKGLTEISEWTKRYTSTGHPISTVADRLLAESKNGDSK